VASMLDNAPMHIVIPYAAPVGPQCQAALAQLQLPVLAALLELLQPTPPLLGSETSLTPLAERVQAKCIGLSGADGLVPWAALDAEHLGLRRVHGESGWAWITPCHWQVNADHVAMDDPRDLALTASESEALREAMQPYFAEDGIQLHPLSNSTWLAHGAMLADLPTASLERVRGGKVDGWMPSQGAQALRRLQHEMQMLLYTHPVNDARSQGGETPVNSFWVSGTGALTALPATTTATQAELVQTLATPAQRDDAYAWTQAWAALDATTLTDLLRRAKANEPVQLTLCGERLATTFELQSSPWWNRLQRRFTAPPPSEFLLTL
jgi:hypothetical protein